MLILKLILVLRLSARDEAVSLLSRPSECPAEEVRRMCRRHCLLLSYLRDIHFFFGCGSDLRALWWLNGEELVFTEELDSLALAYACAQGKARLLL